MRLDSLLDHSVTLGHSYFTAEGNVVGPMISATNLIFSQALSPTDNDLLNTLFIESKDNGKNGTTGYIIAWNAEGRPYIIGHGVCVGYDDDLAIILDLNNTSNAVLAQLLIKITTMLTAKMIK